MKSPSSSVRRCRPLLGTLVDISVGAGDDATALRALEAGFAAIARVHRLMSFHEPASDVARLNREATFGSVQVDERTYRVLAAALEFSAASDGLFDVTVAPLLVEWGFLPACIDVRLRDPSACWRDIELLPGSRVRFARRLAIDLGGIAKGFAVDEAIAAVATARATQALVNAGGDLRAWGDAAEPVWVRDPRRPGGLIEAGLLRDSALATSADADSRRATARGETSPLVHARRRKACDAYASVTVRAPDCMTADALTKVVLSGEPSAHAVLDRYRASALVVPYATRMERTDACAFS